MGEKMPRIQSADNPMLRGFAGKNENLQPLYSLL
jgi:hypothetical protein